MYKLVHYEESLILRLSVFTMRANQQSVWETTWNRKIDKYEKINLAFKHPRKYFNLHVSENFPNINF
jgi:hypothetical protein